MMDRTCNDDESLTDEIKAQLDWSDGAETQELRQDHVAQYENNELHRQPRR